ncbi:hypothetical protein K5B43_000643 [Vibrio parahaemolyticus]|nr:hypothetical protein [Vibrio parahaemolyticus]
MPSETLQLLEVPVSKIEIAFEPYPNDVEQHYLLFLESVKREHFSKLVQLSIFPVKVATFKNKLYAIEHISFVVWLKAKHPNSTIEIIKVKNVRSEEDIIERICYSHFLRHLTPLNAKDLYGLECYWEKTIRQQAIFEQKDYSEMLECDRALPARHRNKLMKKALSNEAKNIISISLD